MQPSQEQLRKARKREKHCRVANTSKRGRLKREALWRETGGHCVYCNGRPDRPDQTKDHIVPASRGGCNALGNLLPSCFSCNVQRGTSFPPSSLAHPRWLQYVRRKEAIAAGVSSPEPVRLSVFENEKHIRKLVFFRRLVIRLPDGTKFVPGDIRFHSLPGQVANPVTCTVKCWSVETDSPKWVAVPADAVCYDYDQPRVLYQSVACGKQAVDFQSPPNLNSTNASA